MAGNIKPRSEMNPEELAAARAWDKRKKALAAMGKPVRATVAETAAAAEIVKAAHRQGMTFRQMEEQLGVGRHILGYLARDMKKRMDRDSYEAILELEFRPPAPGPRRGALLSSVGAIRRLDALRAIGFPRETLAEYMQTAPQNLPSARRRAHIFAEMERNVREMYDKLRDADPRDFATERAVNLSLARSKRLRLPDPNCWDDDTIDDPDAYPEWTGVCGTEEGYRVHIRETLAGNDMPICQKCREVVETRELSKPVRPVLHREHLNEAIAASGMPIKAVARAVLGDGDSVRDTFYRWRDGSRKPKTIAPIEKMAAILDVELDYLLDGKAMQAEATKSPLERGQFNPYVMRIALEASGLSMHKAALLPGSQVSENAFSCWGRGVMKPSDPEKLRPLADYLGVDIEFFYQ